VCGGGFVLFAIGGAGMKLCILVNGRSANSLERSEFLVCAARALPIEVEVIDFNTANRCALPELRKGDALYNASRGGLRLEDWLWRPGVTTFWQKGITPRALQDTTRWIPFHDRAGITQPRTIPHCTNNKTLLTSYVDKLGGLPVIVKIADSTLGRGVMRIDSLASLYSVADHLEHQGQEYVLRQYIDSETTARLMVVGSNVVGALKYVAPEDDFRTNAPGALPGELHCYSSDIEFFAVKATQAIGSELGGVDIAFAADGSPVLLEVNVPCGFARFEQLGVRVAAGMVQHLCHKSGCDAEITTDQRDI
jgi:hypothetical protein